MKKKNDSVKSKIVLFILTVVCCLIIGTTFFVDMTKAPFSKAGEYVLAPIQKGINKVGSWIVGKGDYFQDSATLTLENSDLQKTVDELTVENTRLIQDKEELDRLRDLYELDHQYEDYEKVGARVIAKATGNWYHIFTIDKGSKDGIEVDNNVLAGSGLAGIVIETGTNWSKVRAIIDDSSNVSATISTTKSSCIIAGDLRLIDEGKINLLKLTDTENKVSVGDKVVTSSTSSKFLPGLLVGYVSEIIGDPNNLTKSGYIVPAADFKNIDEVLVIKEQKQQVVSE